MQGVGTNWGDLVRTLVAALAFAVIGTAAVAEDSSLPKGFEAIETIVVIYAENRSFSHLLPEFPGAFDIAAAPQSSVVQKDRDGSPLPSLPPVWEKNTTKPNPAYPRSMPNKPFMLDVPPYNRPPDVLNAVPVHRFY